MHGSMPAAAGNQTSRASTRRTVQAPPADPTLTGRAPPEAASNFSSSPTFFTVCGLLVAAWAASYVLAASDTVHHVLADAMAAVTLLLVALLKNAERRAEHAIQGKLDQLAEAVLAERREHPDDGAEELEEAVGMHDEV